MLVGRAPSDIERFIRGHLKKSIPGHTFEENTLVVFSTFPSHPIPSTNQAIMLQRREYFTNQSQHNQVNRFELFFL